MKHLKTYEDFDDASSFLGALHNVMYYEIRKYIKSNFELSCGYDNKDNEYIIVRVNNRKDKPLLKIIAKQLSKFFDISNEYDGGIKFTLLDPYSMTFQIWFLDNKPQYLKFIKYYMNDIMKKKYEDLIDSEDLGLL